MITANNLQLAMALNKGYCTTSLTEVDRQEIYQCFKNQYADPYELQSRVGSTILNLKPPIVVLMSGGVDSTFMLTMALKCFRAIDILCVSIGYADPAYDESAVAKKICSELGVNHKTYFVGHTAVDEMLYKTNEDTYKDLFFSSSLVPTYFAMKYAAMESDQILTGDGGDELFCGYDRYLVYKYLRGIPTAIAKFAKNTRRGDKLKNFSLNGYESLVEVFTKPEARKMTAIAIPETADNYGTKYILVDNIPNVLNMNFEYVGLPSLNKCMFFDIMTELFGLETKKVDTAVRMAGSPTAVSPFLDMDVLKYCCKLPIEYKYRTFMRKWLLREMINKELPSYNELNKAKKGFAFPLLTNLTIRTWADKNDWELTDSNSQKIWAMFMLDHLKNNGLLQLKETFA